jgi:OmpA-OmpF porin, OOP family
MRPLVLLLAVLASHPALAQEMSDEELLGRLLAQRDAFRATELGETRGIDLVVVDDLQTVPDLSAGSVEQPGAPAAPDGPDALPDLSAEEGTVLAGGGPSRPEGPLAQEVAEEAPDVLTASAEPSGQEPPVVDPDAPAAPETVASGGEVLVVPDADAEAGPGGDAAVLASAQGADALDLGPATETATPTPVVVGVLPPELQVNLRVNFAYDSAVIEADQVPRLEQFCRVMTASGIARFRIVGHTDAAGSDLYNERLSLLRAQEVRRWLTGDCGMPADSVEAIGLGERFLQNAGDPRAAENRRVEFQALS